MGTYDVALIREQGINFAVVCVPDGLIASPSQRDQAVRAWCRQLGMPVALLGARQHRTYGRADIVRWLSSISLSRLPWRRVTVS